MKAHGITTTSKKVFTVDLFDEKSLSDAINRFVNQAKGNITDATEQAIEILCEAGTEKAKAEVPQMPPTATGELRDSIHYEVVREGNKVEGRIIAGTDHAMFVEFGTGLVGASDPHPYNYLGWEYDVNNHWTDGWVYQKNGKYYHTRGQRSNPFMYRTAKYLSENAERILIEGVR